MFGGSKTIVGLDVGSYSVKAVALQPNKGRIALQGYAHMRVGDNDQSVVVRQVIDQLGIKPKNMVSAVSGRSVIVRQVETPRLEKAELKSHIAYEADKYIPFGTDEVVLDCQPLPDRDDGGASNMDVMLVAVRKGFVEDHITMLRSAGVNPSVIDVDVFALTNAFSVLGPQGGGNEEGATALVDIGASKSWVAIVKDDRLLFQREIYLAGNEVSDAIVRTFNENADDVEAIKLNPGETLEALLDAAMPALEDLANEIRLSFDYVEGQFDQDVTRVVLTGGSSQLPSLADILGNILGRPVAVFDPLSGIDLIPSKYDLHGLEANAPALTVALGLACHELNDVIGLGGGQLATWMPRRGGRGAVALPQASGMQVVPDEEEDPSGAMAVAPPPQEAPEAYDFSPANANEPIAPPPPAEEEGLDMASLAGSMPPPSASIGAPSEHFEMPAEAMTDEDGLGILDEPPQAPSFDADAMADDNDPGGDYDPEDSSNRSSMLVVLEDDEPDLGDRGLPNEEDDDELPPLPG
ncbi:MAG: type IV pilus assembly protein PilM [Planctomycetota bacterium]|nr:type IV pilus assembly protein PilM [Planctomycetota bacterium]